MEIKDVIKSQYLAALEMLKQAIEACPDALWHNPLYKNQLWHTAYHTLFYTHFYLHRTMEAHTPWEKHREEYRSLGNAPAKDIIPVPKAEALEFLAFCQSRVSDLVDDLDLDAPSGFPWLPFNKLELQFYNIRHLQQHIGEMFDRLGEAAGIEVRWVGMMHEE